MQVLVSDTSVLIDIERASLTARLFDLPYDFVVPDILYEAELLDWMGPDLIDLGLRVEDWVLLTGDGALRVEAEHQEIAMHGVLWVFDEMERHKICSTALLKSGLEAVRDHPRCRLPIREINRRIARY